MACAADVAAYAACLHLLPSPPAAILIDDFGSLAAADGDGGVLDRRTAERAAVAVLAGLTDAAAGPWRAGGLSRIVIAAAAGPDGAPADLFLMHRWLTLVLNIRPGKGEGLEAQGGRGARRAVGAAPGPPPHVPTILSHPTPPSRARGV